MSEFTDEERAKIKEDCKGINVHNLLQVVKDQNLYMRETRAMVVAQNDRIATLINMMTGVEESLNTMRIQKMGSGPTQT